MVKYIWTGLTKAKLKKPPRLEKVIKSGAESKALLKDAQEKITLQKEGKLDIKRPNEIVPKATDEILKDGQGITLPTKITKKDFKVSKPKVKEGQAQKFLDEERRIIESTEPLKPKDIEGFNINKIRTSDDILRFVEILANTSSTIDGSTLPPFFILIGVGTHTKIKSVVFITVSKESRLRLTSLSKILVSKKSLKPFTNDPPT